MNKKELKENYGELKRQIVESMWVKKILVIQTEQNGTRQECVLIEFMRIKKNSSFIVIDLSFLK